MLIRILGIALCSLLVGFVIATSGVLFFPSLAMAAGPFVCDGVFVAPTDLDSRFGV
ncbi:hypothetical protein HC891_09975 [Candidatus Gracilibacteria bacterium]|nr:hypothetical protein [Candidatus Gracilibacteria bacterium]